jgi:hypothetical protein
MKASNLTLFRTAQDTAKACRWKKTSDYINGELNPHFPVPATARTFRHSWGNNIAHVTIWPDVMQQRISDEPYTGFGQVITFRLNTGECETRYDDFD